MPPALLEKFRATFGRDPWVIAHAPGRIEFIGNHTDYNGGTVLGAAIDRGVWVALAPQAEGRWKFASDQKPGLARVTAEDFTRRTDASSWVNYPLGVLDAMRRRGLGLPAGFDYLAMSDLPPGAGLSSSAAIELASALAFLDVTRQSPSRETVVQLCRQAENEIVGVPCGILDQGVSGFGQKGCLVLIDCRGPRFTTVPLPPDAHLWIFNTHTRHALVEGLYAARHRECMAAARALGVAQLAEVSVDALRQAEKNLPPLLRQRARHVVEENSRVEACRVALEAGDLGAAGQLLTRSHHSSRTLFENSTPELDFLVEALIPLPHVFGARLTGGGFGGAVMALTDGIFSEADAAAVAGAYEGRFSAQPGVLHAQTADGAQILRAPPA